MSRLQSAVWIGSVLMPVLCAVGRAEDVSTAPSENAPAVSAPTGRVLPAETEIHLRLLDAVASNTHKHGDRFRLEVAEPVIVDGQVVIPARAACTGEVVHAAKAGFGGKAGELILASRFVQVGDRALKLRSFSAGHGQDRVDLALGLSFVVVGLFVEGKNISLPAGTDVFAKIAADIEFPVAPPVPTETTPPETTTEIDNNENSQH